MKETDQVLCLTGIGARALDLICLAPCHVTSIDFNSCQSHLLELKIAAIRAFDYYKEMLDFFGVNPSNQRLYQYKRIRKFLSLDAQSYWNKNSKSYHQREMND